MYAYTYHIPAYIYIHIMYAYTYIHFCVQDALQSICKSWGIHDSEFFASMQLLKPYNPDKGAVHLNTTSKMDILKLQVRQHVVFTSFIHIYTYTYTYICI